jgi:hypothetical protein
MGVSALDTLDYQLASIASSTFAKNGLPRPSACRSLSFRGRSISAPHPPPSFMIILIFPHLE